MFYPNFTYICFLELTRIINHEIEQDSTYLKYDSTFRKVWNEKYNRLRESCRKDMKKKFGEASPKFFKRKLNRSPASGFYKLTQWLEQEKPELIDIWRKQKT